MRRIGDVEGDFHILADLHQRPGILQGLERRIAGLGKINNVLEPAGFGEGGIVAEGRVEDEGIVVGSIAGLAAGGSGIAGAAIGIHVQLQPLPLDAAGPVAVLIARRKGKGIAGILHGGERRLRRRTIGIVGIPGRLLVPVAAVLVGGATHRLRVLAPFAVLGAVVLRLLAVAMTLLVVRLLVPHAFPAVGTRVVLVIPGCALLRAGVRIPLTWARIWPLCSVM